MNTTETFWSVDGVSLQTYAHNIVTLGGERLAPPALRGADVTVPYRPGQTWVTKVPDSRVIVLGMWVQGSTEDGRIPTDADAQFKFMENWNALRKLMWTPRRQVKLTKRFQLVFGGPVIEATALAQFDGGLAPDMTGAGRATFTINFKLTDPYFYGKEISISLKRNESREVEILGDDLTTKIEIDFNGSLKNPTVYVEQEDVLSATYNYNIPAGESATLRVDSFSAKEYLAGNWLDNNVPNGIQKNASGYLYYRVPAQIEKITNGKYKIPAGYRDFPAGSQLYPVNSIHRIASGYVDYAGGMYWLSLIPGNARIGTTVLSGTGTIVLRYTPAWL